jgi:hypothetical protein
VSQALQSRFERLTQLKPLALPGDTTHLVHAPTLNGWRLQKRRHFTVTETIGDITGGLNGTRDQSANSSCSLCWPRRQRQHGLRLPTAKMPVLSVHHDRLLQLIRRQSGIDQLWWSVFGLSTPARSLTPPTRKALWSIANTTVAGHVEKAVGNGRSTPESGPRRPVATVNGRDTDATFLGRGR